MQKLKPKRMRTPTLTNGSFSDNKSYTDEKEISGNDMVTRACSELAKKPQRLVSFMNKNDFKDISTTNGRNTHCSQVPSRNFVPLNLIKIGLSENNNNLGFGTPKFRNNRNKCDYLDSMLNRTLAYCLGSLKGSNAN